MELAQGLRRSRVRHSSLPRPSGGVREQGRARSWGRTPSIGWKIRISAGGACPNGILRRPTPGTRYAVGNRDEGTSARGGGHPEAQHAGGRPSRFHPPGCGGTCKGGLQ
jgi:hypothetical protein